MDRDIAQRLQELERRIDGLNLPEVGDGQPVFLSEPYTNTTFDGDSFSTVAAHTKIENTSWSTTIPANAVALIILAQCRDSGSAGTANLFVKLFSTATATNEALNVRPDGKPNDWITSAQGVVPCTSGDIWYRVTASGASTMDVWFTCAGYWL